MQETLPVARGLARQSVRSRLTSLVTDRRFAPALLGFVVLALAAVTGLRGGGSVRMISGVGVIFGLAMILVHLEFGLVLLPIVAVMIPIEIGTGTGSTIVAAMLLAGAIIGLWCIRLLTQQGLTIVKSPINLPLAGFTVAIIVSTITSNVFRDPLVAFVPQFLMAQIGGLSVILVSTGLFFMTMNTVRQPWVIQGLTWATIALGAVTIVKFLAIPGGDLNFSSVGGLFSMWVVALAVGQGLFNDRLMAPLRVALVMMSGGWLYRRLIIDFEWFSGWLPIVVVVAVLIALRSLRLFVAVIAVAGLMVAINWPFFSERLQNETSGSNAQGNLERIDVWTSVLNVTSHEIIFGLGPAGYAPYYMTYSPEAARSSHSNYLDILAQSGLVGSFFFLWFIAALLLIGWRVSRQWRHGFLGGFANGALAGLAGVLVAMALGDWVIPFVYNQTIAGFRFTVHTWLILGALAGLATGTMAHKPARPLADNSLAAADGGEPATVSAATTPTL